MVHRLQYNTLTSLLFSKRTALLDWIHTQEKDHELPLYSSVDIRNSGYKSAVVDTNLFPAGFNNLCATSTNRAVIEFKRAIQSRVPSCRNIVIVTEEHTRNTWYLENVRILATIVENAGFSVKVATFFPPETLVCKESGFMAVTTAVGQPLKIYCIQQLAEAVSDNRESVDFILLNNDLTSGIPDLLTSMNIPIYPSIAGGWHSRLKSHHFSVANRYLNEVGHLLGIDPWLISCLFHSAEKIDITQASDRVRLADAASDLFKSIQSKYNEHGISDKPLVFLKSDNGTYGMGVMPIESPEDILNLNRKARNKLSVGKSGAEIHRFILQEGIPSIDVVENHVGETCIYQIDNRFVGGFYRLNTQKNARQNLNSQGMIFKQICDNFGHLDDPNGTYLSDPIGLQSDCVVTDHEAHLTIVQTTPESKLACDPHFPMHILLARIAGIAAAKEVKELSTGLV